jgi:outer membrane lipoprotein LolB
MATLLTACATRPPAGTGQVERESLYLQRLARLENVDAWALDGRLAISDEKDGGSGSFKWQRDATSSRMDFHGALGRGAWRLRADANGAELDFADGTTYVGESVEMLVHEQVGWAVPVEPLRWWVRGLVAPGAVQQRTLDPDGTLSTLQQDGWAIEYGRYADVGDVAMPVRMTARQADRTVKIAVRKWRLSSQDDPSE